jgi:hypothetical protein
VLIHLDEVESAVESPGKLRDAKRKPEFFVVRLEKVVVDVVRQLVQGWKRKEKSNGAGRPV